ncbi:MAG: glycoside hydrolase, partial [Bacteroidota bacterium]|nr:glycoside hydrolase [Bacteroidota bacterium]
MAFSNYYGLFNDEKLSGVEIIHHGVRTATNGDIRLSPTPGQWDSIPRLIDRKVEQDKNIIEASLSYPSFHFDYVIKAQARDDGVFLNVNLKNPLPKELEGRAGFNLEFLPAAYFEKSYMMDDKAGTFPLYPAGTMEKSGWGTIEPKPVASGTTPILAPEDPARRISIQAKNCTLALYDGRNQA